MKEFPIRLIREGVTAGVEVPVGMALVDVADVDAAGITHDDAIRRVAAFVDGPVAINCFDMTALTTTSDGILVEGAIVKMGAGDAGVVHDEFGILPMAELAVTDSLVAEEPHLRQIDEELKGRSLYRGPDPHTKLVPVHNVVITGRTANNNSGTEVMNLVTMGEILLPILGQLQVLRGEPVMVGLTGECISVALGLTVAEKFGRIFPFRQFQAGDTAHASGRHAKNLKSHIPCMVPPKRVLAAAIARALNRGMVPGLHLGVSPAVLSVAQALGKTVAVENITPLAREELASVGIGEDRLVPSPTPIDETELLERADDIIPGAEGAVTCRADEVSERLLVPAG